MKFMVDEFVFVEKKDAFQSAPEALAPQTFMMPTATQMQTPTPSKQKKDCRTVQPSNVCEATVLHVSTCIEWALLRV